MPHCQTCSIRGYRPEQFPFPFQWGTPPFLQMEADIQTALVDAAQAGYSNFLCGMSRGFDLICGRILLDLRRQKAEGAAYRLIAVTPFEGFENHWSPAWKRAYAHILQSADDRITVYPNASRSSFSARNRFMLDRSERMLCYWDGKPGEVASAVAYARVRGLRIVNIAKGPESGEDT